jgi:hypothetical protein
MLTTSIFGLIAVVELLRHASFGGVVRVLLFVLIFLLSILGVNVLNNNYPDTPVAGKQKTNFNRLFLLNFLFLVFLFGIIFAEYKELLQMTFYFNRPVYNLPFEMLIPLLSYGAILLLQFYILYGLYELRRELYFNFMKKEFEFEKEKARQG